MPSRPPTAIFLSSPRILLLALWLWLALTAGAQGELNAEGAPRYGSHALAPGFSPAPATFSALSGGDIDVKALRLGDNCLGYAASDPDFVIHLDGDFSRITFLVASDADTTLVISLPDGSYACNDDANGLNPALVFFNPPPGAYRVWIGSYAPDAFDESVLYVADAGPEALPTTATGPDPGRDPLYGETALAPGFQPSPFTKQILGGGRSRVADFIAGADCRGYVSEAPDFSVRLAGAFRQITFALYSPAEMTLLVKAADGGWHCGAAHQSRDQRVSLKSPPAGQYPVWVGGADEGNNAASVFYVTEHEADEPSDVVIDASCEGMLAPALGLGGRAIVTGASSHLHAAPETASTVVYTAPSGRVLRLVGGPVCKDAHRWWRAETAEGIAGWLADGDATTRWLAASP